MMRLRFAALAAAASVAALIVGPTALAQAHPVGGANAASSANIQGNDQQAWINDAHIHQFYELSVASLKAPPSADSVAAYEQKSYAIFRDFGVAMGVGPEHMQDHLKLIPRQVAQIAKEDPHALDTYESFVEAMFGPK